MPIPLQLLFPKQFPRLRIERPESGIVRRSDIFATVDNTVTLPGYTEADAAIYYSINGGERWTKLNKNLPTVAVHDILIHLGALR